MNTSINYPTQDLSNKRQLEDMPQGTEKRAKTRHVVDAVDEKIQALKKQFLNLKEI